MKRLLIMMCGLTLLVASCAPEMPITVPTLAQLPTLTPSELPGSTPEATVAPPSPTVSAQATEAAVVATAAFTATSNPTASPVPSMIPPSATRSIPTVESTQAITVIPSLTITNTITPIPSATYTATLDLGPFGALAALAANATVLPVEQRYLPPTQTALALAGEQLRQATLSQFQLPTALPPGSIGGTAASDGSSVVTVATLPAASVPCPASPPGGLGAMLAADSAFAATLGCPLGGISQLTAALQPFERGAMLYVQGTPGVIDVLENDARFRRFDDTWVQGIDPETTSLTPPSGLLEPIRGFGKVWRANLDVQTQLGWATAPEAGQTITVQRFDRGLAVYLPAQNQTYVLVDDVPFSGGGAWRAFSGGF